MDDEVDFGEVLARDLANIVAKAANGQPLSIRERKIIEDESKKKKVTPSVKAAVEVLEQGEDVPLVRGRNGYFFEYPHYEELYGKSVRTVKRWVALGRVVGEDGVKDECPLDDPEKLAIWWGRRMTMSCPEGILRAVVAQRKAGGGAEVPEEVAPVEVDFDVSPVGDDEKGLGATLGRLEELEVLFAREARKGTGAKAWLDTVSRMGPVIKQLREEQVELGKLLPKDMAEQVLVDLHGAIERGTREMVHEMARCLGLEVTPKMMELWGGVCDELFLGFGKAVFGARL